MKQDALPGAHIVLNTLTHGINIYVISKMYVEALAKFEKDKAEGSHREFNMPPSYENIAIKPGYNMFNDQQWARLKETKAFAGLLEMRGIYVNNKTEFKKYDSEVKDILENNQQYKEAMKKKEFEETEKRASEAERKTLELEKLNAHQKKQLSALESRLEKLEASLNGDQRGQHKT